MKKYSLCTVLVTTTTHPEKNIPKKQSGINRAQRILSKEPRPQWERDAYSHNLNKFHLPTQ